MPESVPRLFMFKSPLIRTLQLLTQEEIEDLHLFVASPIFNEVHRYHDKVKLFEYLKKYYPDFEHENLKREVVSKMLYPGRAKPVQELERTMALLLPIVRQYITVLYFEVRNTRTQAPSLQEVGAHPQRLVNFIRQQLSLMRFFSGRLPHLPIPAETSEQRSQNFFQNLADKLEQVFQSQSDFTKFPEHAYCEYYYLRFLAEYEKSNFISLQQDRRSGDANMLSAVEQLDEFYLLTKLDMMCKLVIRQRAINLFHDDPVRQKRLMAHLALTKQVVQQLLTECKYLRSPGITIYCALFDFLSHEPGREADHLAERFNRLLQQSTHRMSVPTSRLRDFNILLRNYWVDRWNTTKDITFLDKNHRLHREQLRLLGPEENLPSSQFQTIILTALKLRKIDWAYDILEIFDPKRIVGEANAEILFDILQSAVYFARAEVSSNTVEKVDTLQKALNKIPHYLNYGALQDGYLYSIAATLDVKIRFELDILHEDEGASMLHTTKTRIGRFKSMSEGAKDRYLGFFPFAAKLFKMKEKQRFQPNTSMQPVKETLAQIKENSSVVEREWLLAKCTELLAPKTGNK